MGKRVKGEGSLYQTKNNGVMKWCATYSYYDSEHKRRFIRGFGDTPQEALRRKNQNIQKRATQPKRVNAPKFQTVAEEYLANSSARSQAINKYRRNLELHVYPHIGAKSISAITTADIDRLIHQTLRELGTSAREHTFKNIKSVFIYAVKADYITRNPMLTAQKPKHIPQAPVKDAAFMERNINIAFNLLKWLEDPNNPLHDEHYARTLFMFLGLRRGELLGLTWDCVKQLEKKNKASIVIKQQLQHNKLDGWYIEPRSKNSKTRTIPLPERFRKELLKLKNKNQHGNKDWSYDLIFLQPDNTNLTYNYHQRHWQKILSAYYYKNNPDDYELITPTDERYFRPHATRHICATYLFQTGVRLETVQEILGHSTVIQSLYYTHITKTDKRNATDNLESIFQ